MSPALIASIGATGVVVIAILVVFLRGRVRVDTSHALIVSRMQGEPLVRFSDTFVAPIFQRGELVDLSVKRILISRRGRVGLVCADNIRADIEALFLLRVNRTVDDILRVANTVGTQRAGDMKTLEDLFSSKFADALKTVGRQLDFEQLHTERERFKDQVIAVIGRDLNGFILDDVAIDYLEQTPVDQLDPNNILDAEGIRKITTRSIAARRDVRDVASSAPVARVPLAQKLEEGGLLDVTVTIEIACSASVDAKPMHGSITEHRDAIAKLNVVSPQVLDSLGSGELAIGDGRASVRFVTQSLDEHQLIAAARLVHTLRQDASAFR